METVVSSLKDIKEYFYNQKEELYEIMLDLAKVLKNPLDYILFVKAIKLYWKYGYPEIFEYLADVFEWTARKLEKEHPNFFDYYSFYGEAILLRRLANRLRNTSNSTDRERFEATIMEFSEIANKLGGEWSAFRKYVIENPEEGLELLRRAKKVLSKLMDIVVEGMYDLLTRRDPRLLRDIFQKIDIPFVADMNYWWDYFERYIPRPRYIHKKIYNLVKELTILHDGIFGPLYDLEIGRFI